MRHSLLLTGGLPLVLGACVGYRHVDESTAISAQDKVIVWSQGRQFRMHGVAVLLDSITGIPYDRPLSCDSCWFGIPRAQVDSAKVNRTLGTFRTIGQAASAVFGAYLIGFSQ